MRLAVKPGAPRLGSSGPLTKTLKSYGKELIEAALAKSNGKLPGQNGAAPNSEFHGDSDFKIQTAQHKEHTIR